MHAVLVVDAGVAAGAERPKSVGEDVEFARRVVMMVPSSVQIDAESTGGCLDRNGYEFESRVV